MAAGIEQIIYLYPVNVRPGEGKRKVSYGRKEVIPLHKGRWHGLRILVPDPHEPNRNIIELCSRKRSLVVSPELDRLKELHLERLSQERLHYEQLVEAHRCVVAVGGDNFLISPLRESPPIFRGKTQRPTLAGALTADIHLVALFPLFHFVLVV